MKEQHKRKNISLAALGNLLLVLIGLALALGLAEVLMRVFPDALPAEVRVNPPARRLKALLDDDYELRQSDGDLFHYMRENIMPLSPEQDRVVARVHMITDANGFRNSPPEKTTYDIVALGDSFTRATGVASPWTQKLSEYAGREVLNLGDIGFGPQDELKVLRQYGLRKQPQWVILAYFEGNDLYDAAAYKQANPFISFRFGRYILGRSVRAWQEWRSGPATVAVPSNYRYPITMKVNQKDLQMVFFSSYISWLALSREEIEASQNYELVGETILKIQKSSQAAPANFLLVYVPSKSHVYLPYLTDPETVTTVFADVPLLELDESGFLQFSDKTATPELVRRHMDDQAHLLADFAADHTIHFLDLTPIFQEEGGRGTELYYTFDTHWNQLGHNLAAETIYEYMNELSQNTAGNSPGP